MNKLKLSEAILLGSVNYHPIGCHFFIENYEHTIKYACAMGMAVGAVGREAEARSTITIMGQKIENVRFVYETQWPWLANQCDIHCPVCNEEPACLKENEDEWVIGRADYAGMIVHLFDSHVAPESDEKMTLEQLVDWVKSVEPQEKSDETVGSNFVGECTVETSRA